MATLYRAVPFTKVDGVAVAVCKDLYFHVARFDDGSFQNQFVVTEGLFGFGAGPFDVVCQFGFAMYQAHASATATGGGFDH